MNIIFCIFIRKTDKALLIPLSEPKTMAHVLFYKEENGTAWLKDTCNVEDVSKFEFREFDEDEYMEKLKEIVADSGCNCFVMPEQGYPIMIKQDTLVVYSDTAPPEATADQFTECPKCHEKFDIQEVLKERFRNPALGDYVHTCGEIFEIEFKDRPKPLMPDLSKLVVHVREPYDVYIGRGSPYGNRFVVGQDGTRDEVIAKYEVWLKKQPELVARVRQELRGKILGCHCAPRPCHGDVLARIANS